MSNWLSINWLEIEKCQILGLAIINYGLLSIQQQICHNLTSISEGRGGGKFCNLYFFTWCYQLIRFSVEKKPGYVTQVARSPIIQTKSFGANFNALISDPWFKRNFSLKTYLIVRKITLTRELFDCCLLYQILKKHDSNQKKGGLYPFNEIRVVFRNG